MTSTDAKQDATAAGLRYAGNNTPGLTRRLLKGGPAYFDSDQRRVTDPTLVQRLDSLAVPPAWTDVWLSAQPNSHIQATGRDAKGRKQSLYHPEWIARRAETKFEHMRDFGSVLPKIRAMVDHDLRSHGWPKRKVVALVVRLLEATRIRIGNKQYAARNQSFGLTTFVSSHAEVGSQRIKFKFKGKSGKFHDVEVSDRRLARLVRECQELPGQSLFQYLDDDGVPSEVSSSDVNDYLRDITHRDFTAKDFRTWIGTREALRLVREQQGPAHLDIKHIVSGVASILGNTPAVCKSAYIHPGLLAVDQHKAKWITSKLPRSTKFLDRIERLALSTLP